MTKIRIQKSQTSTIFCRCFFLGGKIQVSKGRRLKLRVDTFTFKYWISSLSTCNIILLGGGFKYFLCSPLLGEGFQVGLIFFKWVETTRSRLKLDLWFFSLSWFCRFDLSVHTRAFLASLHFGAFGFRVNPFSKPCLCSGRFWASRSITNSNCPYWFSVHCHKPCWFCALSLTWSSSLSSAFIFLVTGTLP